VGTAHPTRLIGIIQNEYGGRKMGKSMIEILESVGFEISVRHHPAKTERGKNRIEIDIRQVKPPRWFISGTLSSKNDYRVKFEER
jgi:hypothetical protein